MKEHGRFEALDGWRGIAALSVAAMHAHIVCHMSGPALAHAGLAVDFFFVLSGFVIAHATASGFVSMTAARGFLWRRFARLWPTHVTMLASFVMLDLLLAAARPGTPVFHGTDTPTALLANLTLLHSLGLTGGDSWNRASWSIGAEFWVYVAFAIVTVALRHPRQRLAVFALVISGAGLVLLHSPAGMAVTQGLSVLRCAYGFFFGTLLYALHLHTPNRRGCLEWIALALVITFVATSNSMLAFAAPAVFGACIWVFASERGMLSVLLKTRLLALIGKISYSIYMVHELLLRLVFAGVKRFAPSMTTMRHEAWAGMLVYELDLGSNFAGDIAMAAFLIFTVGCGWLLWTIVEAPARRALMRVRLRSGASHA